MRISPFLHAKILQATYSTTVINDKTIIAYHFGQYYCLLQKEWRLPKIEIDWLIKSIKKWVFS